ncbi:hypothetical protein M422DRAFT_272605 [Sphaerobolus stellatus SS14]|uniref:Uncharacterized protein n=1 Tax=Sphaerobolus stellatus (strain SS14) TaxID=990650 RepID=A0A0C9UB54_SPHS4|nr:hypothetical protein M422DRAFT_272605 [Sphaerobolus stellatus SS14]
MANTMHPYFNPLYNTPQRPQSSLSNISSSSARNYTSTSRSNHSHHHQAHQAGLTLKRSRPPFSDNSHYGLPSSSDPAVHHDIVFLPMLLIFPASNIIPQSHSLTPAQKRAFISLLTAEDLTTYLKTYLNALYLKLMQQQIVVEAELKGFRYAYNILMERIPGSGPTGVSVPGCPLTVGHQLILPQYGPQPKHEDYEDLPCWTFSEFNNLTQNSARRIDHDLEPPDGGDICQQEWYLFHEDGSPLFWHEAADLRAELYSAWNTFKDANLAPTTWKTSGSSIAKDFLRATMYQKFPFLMLCDGHWKVNRLAMKNYSAWAHTYLPAEVGTSDVPAATSKQSQALQPPTQNQSIIIPQKRPMSIVSADQSVKRTKLNQKSANQKSRAANACVVNAHTAVTINDKHSNTSSLTNSSLSLSTNITSASASYSLEHQLLPDLHASDSV